MTWRKSHAPDKNSEASHGDWRHHQGKVLPPTPRIICFAKVQMKTLRKKNVDWIKADTQKDF